MFGWLKTLARLETRYPSAVAGEIIYAIGDIHGRSDCLRQAHALIDEDLSRRSAAAASEIYIGDYVDSGPDSKGVIDAAGRPGGLRTMSWRCAAITKSCWSRFCAG